MNLPQKFVDASSTQAIWINIMDIDRKCLIVRVDRITTKFEPTVLLSLRDKPFNVVKVFMPRRYNTAFSDRDIQQINTQSVKMNLVYRGHCSKSNSYVRVLYTEEYKKNCRVFLLLCFGSHKVDSGFLIHAYLTLRKWLRNNICVFLCYRMRKNFGCWMWGASRTVTSDTNFSLYL